MKKGFMIVIDGTDGSGKATQTELLTEHLRLNGHAVATFDFPNHSKPSGYFVDKYLAGDYGSLDEIGPYSASTFFAVDRFDLKQAINQALAEGKIVICDRWVTANLAHQGAKILDKGEREKYYQWNLDLEYAKMNLPQPDLNLILHVPCEIGQKLVDNKASRDYIAGAKRDLHEADLNHLRLAESVYLELVKILPNTKLIECAPDGEILSIEIIAEMVYEEVKNFLND